MRSWIKGLLAGALAGAAAATGGCEAMKAAEAGLFGENDAATFDTALDRICLTRAGRYAYQVDGLPPADLRAIIDVEGPGRHGSLEMAREAIDAMGVRVSLTLRGRRFETEPVRMIVKDGRLEGDWGKTPESWAGEPLEYIGAEFRPARHEAFSVTIDVAPGKGEPKEDVWGVVRIRNAALARTRDGAAASPLHDPAEARGASAGE